MSMSDEQRQMGADAPVPPRADIGARRVSESVKRRLTEMIWSGELVAGERLPPERTLMERLGVSRSVVREAINDLSSRGLLKTRPGFRPIVSKPDYDSALGAMGQVVSNMLADDERGVWNLFETRMFLEAALARSAAASARCEDIQRLKAALVRNREAIGKRGEFELTDVDFHNALYEIPRNPIYPVVHRAYVAWLYERWRQIEANDELDRINYAGHEAIFMAIVNRDPDAAELALRRHLTLAWEYVRVTFRYKDSTIQPLGDAVRPGAE
ncbi:GntR family transcriptional regulator [Variovorax sp. GT1P44]|uniref:GntR family transcriptional regulator n=1 Tax=Variovorax sp. GT1P44 TaxID=3443742 RepID=UPI003F48498C